MIYRELTGAYINSPDDSWVNFILSPILLKYDHCNVIRFKVLSLVPQV